MKPTKSAANIIVNDSVAVVPASTDLLLFAPLPNTPLVTDAKHCAVADLDSGPWSEYLQKQIGQLVIACAGLQSKLDAFAQTNNELLAENIRLKSEIEEFKSSRV